tara:strand:+ start:35 stop:208 length:174 start_codon:yes stop_codon:yes gene_type:complete
MKDMNITEKWTGYNPEIDAHNPLSSNVFPRTAVDFGANWNFNEIFSVAGKFKLRSYY